VGLGMVLKKNEGIEELKLWTKTGNFGEE